ENDCVHFGEVERHRREPGTVDCGDTVLGEELAQTWRGARPRSMTLCPPILITVASGRMRKSAAASAAAWSCASVSDRCMSSDSSSAVGFAMSPPYILLVLLILKTHIPT